MGTRGCATSLFLSTTLVAAAIAVRPAAQTSASRLGFSDSASVAWVLVPVVARRAQGSAATVTGLAAEDFRLFVDERPVPVQSFESGADNPIRLIFLQDLSGSMSNGGKLAASRSALRLFLDDARPGDETALVTFASGEARVEVAWTGDVSRLTAAMADWRAYGTTALHDAVAFLPRIRAPNEALRRAAVLLSDGGDNASTLTPAESRAALRAAELPLYALDLRFQRGERASRRPREEASFSHLLELLSITTGGRYHAVEDAASLAESCRAISAELRQQYVLGFETRNQGSPGDHTIRLEVRRKKVRLRHRRGYFGLAPRDV